MDETKKRKDDSTAAPGDTSGGTKGTSKDKGKLYTEAQIAKFKSDAAAEAGRQRKAAEQERDSLKQELESNNNRLDSLEREANESRLAEARDNPEQLRAYQRDQANTKRERDAVDKERDLARREAQLKADRAEVDKDKGVVSIAYIAAKHGLEVERLEKRPKATVAIERGAVEPELASDDPRRSEAMWIPISDLIGEAGG